jgi:hypothetical protein
MCGADLSEIDEPDPEKEKKETQKDWPKKDTKDEP